MKYKTMEELGDELCEYCPLEDYQKGVHCYGGEPVMCEGSHCEEAYENYKEEVDADMSEENYPELTSKDFKSIPSDGFALISKGNKYIRGMCSVPGTSCRGCPFVGNCVPQSRDWRHEQCKKELIRRGVLPDPKPSDYITDIEELKKMDGMKVSCVLQGQEIPEAQIQILPSGNGICIAQNVVDGNVRPVELFKYRYGYNLCFISSRDWSKYKIRRLSEPKVTFEDEAIADIKASIKKAVGVPIIPTDTVWIDPAKVYGKSITIPEIGTGWKIIDGERITQSVNHSPRKRKEKKKYKPEDYPSIDWKSKVKQTRKPHSFKEW